MNNRCWLMLGYVVLLGAGACMPAAERERQEAESREQASQQVIYRDIISKMEMHVKRGLDCMLCHKEVVKEIEENGGKTTNEADNKGESTTPAADEGKPQLVFDMKCCVNCHRSYGKQTFCAIDLPNRLVECRTCHLQLRKDVKPQYHYQNWLPRHGGYADSDRKLSAECTICHGNDGCTDCHRAQKPSSHTNFWRQRSHGLIAGTDRRRCNTCHTADYCQRCHANTTPQNHVASWGRSRNTHCLSCHEPLSGNRCQVCHANTSVHLVPAPNDAVHSLSGDCRVCHPNSHIYNGQDCRICHRPR